MLAGIYYITYYTCMQFDVRMHSPDMLTSVYQFPGDEETPLETYQSVIFGGYVTTTATLYGAARALELPVDAETFERWKRICATAGLLDDFLDDSPDPAKSQELYDEELDSQLQGASTVSLPEWADRRLVPAINMLAASVLNMPEEQRSKMIMSAQSIGRLAITKTSLDNVEAYAGVLQKEATETGNLIRYSVTDSIYNDPRFDAFASWCEQAITLATLYDHARDLSLDNQRGRTVLEPSLRNKLKIGSHALRPFVSLMLSSPTRRASFGGIRARLRYSPLPTKMIFPKVKQ